MGHPWRSCRWAASRVLPAPLGPARTTTRRMPSAGNAASGLVTAPESHGPPRGAVRSSTALGVPDGLGLEVGLDPGQVGRARPVRLDGVGVASGWAQDALEVLGTGPFEVRPLQAVRVGGTGQVDGVDVLVGGQPWGDLGG